MMARDLRGPEGAGNVKQPRALVFDCGDTLMTLDELDVERGAQRLFALAGNPRGVRLPAFLAAVDKLQADWRRRTEQSMLEGAFASLLRNAADRLGLIFERTMDELEEEFWQAAARMTPTPGIRELLDDAADQGIPCGILSNAIFSEHTLRSELRRHELEKHFVFVMTSTDYGMQKPHPELFATVAGRLALAPEDIWFLGDSLQCDIAGALEAGMQAVWYNPLELPKDMDVTPTAECRDWNQVALWLDDLSLAPPPGRTRG
jgi:putative hydrolase of the HAD superfamily